MNERWFFTTASLGLSVAVTRLLTRDLKRRWGKLAYAYAAVRAVLERRAFDAEIVAGEQRLALRAVQIVVGNGRYYGSALPVAEDAEIDDGWLDLYAVEARSRWRLFTLGRRSRRAGTVSGPDVHTLRARKRWRSAPGPQDDQRGRRAGAAHAGDVRRGSPIPRRVLPVIPRTVKGLSLVSFFNDIASEMVYPLLPAFITGTLGAGPLALGLLDRAADLTSALVKWVSGRLADRPGWRRPLILGGYATAVLVRPLIAVANAAWQVIGFRVIDRVGKGLRTPPRDALIAEVTPPLLRGRAFGFHRAADHIGAMLGSVLAWLLLEAGRGRARA